MRLRISGYASLVVAALVMLACGGPSSMTSAPGPGPGPSPGQAPPSIVGFSLQSTGTAGQRLVVVVGGGFQQGATFTFNGISATSVGVDPAGASILGVIPAQQLGSVSIDVTNPDGQTDTLVGSDSGQAPSASFAPASAAAGANYVFGGLHFLSPKVFFGLVEAPIVSITSGRFAGSLQMVTVHVPSLPTGTYEVVVVNSDGQFSTVQPQFVVP